jgi:hypothetical protein
MEVKVADGEPWLGWGRSAGRIKEGGAAFGDGERWEGRGGSSKGMGTSDSEVGEMDGDGGVGATHSLLLQPMEECWRMKKDSRTHSRGRGGGDSKGMGICRVW